MPFFVVTKTNGRTDYRVEHSDKSLWTKEPTLATEIDRTLITDEEATYPLDVLIASYHKSQKDKIKAELLERVIARMRELESIIFTSEDRAERNKAKKDWEILAGKPFPK